MLYNLIIDIIVLLCNNIIIINYLIINDTCLLVISY